MSAASPRRWLITGASGQLGSDLARVLSPAPTPGVAVLGGPKVMAATRADLDVTDSAAVRAAVRSWRPDVIINAAAYTAVDAAETDEDAAFLLNATAPGFLARAAAENGARFIHVSTDYVYAGDADRPYTEADETDPRSAYGRTKLAGEAAVLELDPTAHVVRTAWVYGQTGGNFVKTMLRLAGERDTVSVVQDQRGSPTWSQDLARGLVALAQSDAAGGLYHCTNTEDTTWFGFTQAIFEAAELDPARVLPTTSADFVRPAPRPAYSVLSHAKWDAAGLPEMPTWRTALRTALPAIRDTAAL
ncbi:MAG: dTDP-4-dehydrorhamnose reductase [Jatrophihabitantaceae bacterium]|nr:dTDP-4-dehydrorhamnose reductase [Jatrophihabitantaceae bacterium]